MTTIKFLDRPYDIYVRPDLSELEPDEFADDLPESKEIDDLRQVKFKIQKMHKGDIDDSVEGFDPAFILTDDAWLCERLRKYAEEHPDTARIFSDSPTMGISAAIPKNEIALCIP